MFFCHSKCILFYPYLSIFSLLTEVFFYDNKSIPNSLSQTFFRHMKIYKLFLRNIPSAAQQELSRSGSRGTPHALKGVYLALYEKKMKRFIIPWL